MRIKLVGKFYFILAVSLIGCSQKSTTDGIFFSTGSSGNGSNSIGAPTPVPSAQPTPITTPAPTPTAQPTVAPTSKPTSQPTPVASATPVAAPTSFGTWLNVTPSTVDLNTSSPNFPSCPNYGPSTIQADPNHLSVIYTEINCQGIWKSVDYGASWIGPINTGTNGKIVSDCAGGITIAPSSGGGAPTIYQSCIYGGGLGFWKSTDGGVNWAQYIVARGGVTNPIPPQDYYPPIIDPYDTNHLLMDAHEQNYMVESFDGGQNWHDVTLASGMIENGGTGIVTFINTGNATTTKTTWLWLAQDTGGLIGTWRTENGGSAPTWTKVDSMEHSHGRSQIYQPDNNGVVFLAGCHRPNPSNNCSSGIVRSADFGKTWVGIGNAGGESLVFATAKNLYAMFGFPIGSGGTYGLAFEVAAQPGTGSWAMPTVSNLTQGPGEVAVVNDGTHSILVGAMYNAGLWRYIEP